MLEVEAAHAGRHLVGPHAHRKAVVVQEAGGDVRPEVDAERAAAGGAHAVPELRVSRGDEWMALRGGRLTFSKTVSLEDD